MSAYALGMDIGGSHVSAALVDLETRELIEASRAHHAVQADASAADLLDAWAGAGREAAQWAKGQPVRHAGLGMPGPFEYALGISRLEHKFAALYGMNVGKALIERWRGSELDGAAVYFANDASVWALGEWWGGAGRGSQRMIGVTLGTGLGSGFIANGRILTESEGVPPGGEIWNLAYRQGINEDYVSGRAIASGYALRRRGKWNAVLVAQRALTGDPDAREVFAQIGSELAAILSPWVSAFVPDCLVVGGSIARSWALFSPSLKAGLAGLDCRVTGHFEGSSLLGGAVLGILAEEQ